MRVLLWDPQGGPLCRLPYHLGAQEMQWAQAFDKGP